MRPLRTILRDSGGASAVEFALVLPLLLIFLFGIIDGGRLLWQMNEAEKATQMGARFAAVTDPVLGSEFDDYSFPVNDLAPQGSPVPIADFDNAVCNNVSCSCTGGNVCSAISYDPDAFAAIVARMHAMDPQIEAANVHVEYKNVGLGYAGDPNGPDVAPLITVRLTGLTFQPITTLLLAQISLPDFRASLTGEDLIGNVSN